MGLAELILEYLKVLAWPLVVLSLVLRFRRSILRILDAVGGRLASAETVKVGLLGQEVEISGTAKELTAAGQQLLAAAEGDQLVQQKASKMLQAIPQLNNPVADIVGIALLEGPPEGLTADALLEKVLDSLSPRKDRERFRAAQAQFVLMSMAREVEKILTHLVELDFAAAVEGHYSLTSVRRGCSPRALDGGEGHGRRSGRSLPGQVGIRTWAHARPLTIPRRRRARVQPERPAGSALEALSPPRARARELPPQPRNGQGRVRL